MNINLIKIGSEINFIGALLLQAHKNEMGKFKNKYKSANSGCFFMILVCFLYFSLRLRFIFTFWIVVQK